MTALKRRWKRPQARDTSRGPISSAATADAHSCEKRWISHSKAIRIRNVSSFLRRRFRSMPNLPNAPEIIFPIRMNGAPCSRSAAMTAGGCGGSYVVTQLMRSAIEEDEGKRPGVPAEPGYVKEEP